MAEEMTNVRRRQAPISATAVQSTLVDGAHPPCRRRGTLARTIPLREDRRAPSRAERRRFMGAPHRVSAQGSPAAPKKAKWRLCELCVAWAGSRARLFQLGQGVWARWLGAKVLGHAWPNSTWKARPDKRWHSIARTASAAQNVGFASKDRERAVGAKTGSAGRSLIKGSIGGMVPNATRQLRAVRPHLPVLEPSARDGRHPCGRLVPGAAGSDVSATAPTCPTHERKSADEPNRWLDPGHLTNDGRQGTNNRP
jgi:hypothetical protein